MTPSDVLKLAKEKGAKIVDLRFIDMPGLWQHFSIPVAELTEDLFTEGIGFDGSSIRGFQAINESDMLLFPDPTTAQMDPFTAVPTLVLICDVKDPLTGRQLRPRPALRRQEGRGLREEHGPGRHHLHRPRARVLHLRRRPLRPGLQLRLLPRGRRRAGHWNSGRVGTPENPNLGYRARPKQGYFPVSPADHHQDLRSEMVINLESVGVKIEVHHHEVASAGQTEIDMRFDTLLKMADKVLWYKYCTKNTAKKHGKTVTFMPKPIFQDNGSGMHTHQSLWKGGKNLFYAQGRRYADISEMCKYYIGGILKHAPALLAFIAPSTNSTAGWCRATRRPSTWPTAPATARPRSASRCTRTRRRRSARVPHARPDLQPLPVVRGLRDGRARRGAEQDRPRQADGQGPLRAARPRKQAQVKQLPGSLDVALDNLEKDHDFLLKGDVFTKDLIETWIDYKRKNEVDAIRLRPHPWEFALYFDI